MIEIVTNKRTILAGNPYSLFSTSDGAKVAIFDFDGTIGATVDIWVKVDEIFFRRRGYDCIPDVYHSEIIGMRLQEIAAFTIDFLKNEGRYRGETVDDLLTEWKNDYNDFFQNGVNFIQGADVYVRALKKLGIKTAIATAAEISLLKGFLDHHGVMDLFDAVVTCDDVNASKPNPAVYLEAARRLGATLDQAVIFEDSIVGLTGAKNALPKSIVCIMSEDKDYDEKMKIGDVVIKDYSELYNENQEAIVY